MLFNVIASTKYGATILELIDIAALIIEVLAVVIIVVAILYAAFTYFVKVVRDRAKMPELYVEFRERLARALLLGLEILVAADIIRTVALEATLQSVVVLGLLVLIRTFLSWALVVEIEGRWPWSPRGTAD